MPVPVERDQLTIRHQGRIPDTTLECIHHLRQSLPQAVISVEVEKPGRAGLENLAAEADMVFYSKSWAQVLLLLPMTIWPTDPATIGEGLLICGTMLARSG